MVQEALIDITDDGESSFTIIQCILNGTTSDIEIAEETEIKLNTVRKILYRLNEAGIATYKRSKNPESSGEVYSWKFDKERVDDIITKKYEKYSDEDPKVYRIRRRKHVLHL